MLGDARPHVMAASSHTPNDSAARMEIYKLAVEMADRTSARRAGANSFFFTLHGALAAFVGIVSSARREPPNATLPSFDPFGLVITAAAGIVLSVTWWALLRYYRRLNGAKFEVINGIEQALPEQPYTREWELLHPDESLEEDPAGQPEQTGWARWLRRNHHREASVVEQVVPFVFAAIYVVLAVRVVLR